MGLRAPTICIPQSIDHRLLSREESIMTIREYVAEINKQKPTWIDWVIFSVVLAAFVLT